MGKDRLAQIGTGMDAGVPGAPGFGALLKRYRVAAGLSQEALAEQARLSPQTISALERGQRLVPYRDTVGLLVQALGLTRHEAAALEAAVSRRRGPLGAAPHHVPQEPMAQPRPVSPAAPAGKAAVLPVLVGRAHELALLDRHLRGEGPPVLLFAGEPGIGKSRLLREATTRASGYGLRDAAGGCQRRSGQVPYAPVLEALKHYIQRRAAADLRAEMHGCAWLVRLLPELAGGPIEPLPAWTLPPEQERRLLFEAVGRFLANVAGPAGTLLVLDDLQWAGADALDLLATLARAAEEIPLRVVGAYRDTDVQPGDELSHVLADLAHAGLAMQRTLAPLAPEDVGRLLDMLLEGAVEDLAALRETVMQRTGGVPFFVVSCAQVVRLHDATDGGAAPIPWGVAQGIRQRVAALTEAAREILGVAAVMGRVVQPDLLTAVAEQPEWAVLAALNAASRARLLVEDGTTSQFAHDLIREVVEADAGAARRLVLHRRMAQALEESPGGPRIELLAYHYSRSGEHGKAAAYLEQAGDHATAQSAQAAAAGYYQEAADRLEKIGHAHDAAVVREKLGEALLTAARYDAALVALEPAAATYRLAGDLEGEGRVTARIGRAYNYRGATQEGQKRIQPLLERLAVAGPSPALAELYLTLTQLAHQGAASEGFAVAERASEIAAALGDDSVTVRAAVLRGSLLDHFGHAEEGLRILEAVILQAEMAPDAYVLLNNVAHIYDHLGEFASSLHCIERALAAAERIGDTEWIAFLTMHRGFTTFFNGDWAPARQDGEAALALYGRIGATWRNAHPLMVLGVVSYGEGRWEQAEDHLARCVALAASLGNIEALVMAQSVLAELDLRQGRAAAARARLLPLIEDVTLTIKEKTTYLVPKLAWAHLDLGDVEAAARIAVQAVADTRAKTDRLNLVEALRVQALVALRQGCWSEAERNLTEALSLAQSMRYPWGEARVLRVYGDLHAQKGEPGPARARLEAARAIFQRLGARKDAEQAAFTLEYLQ